MFRPWLQFGAVVSLLVFVDAELQFDVIAGYCRAYTITPSKVPGDDEGYTYSYGYYGGYGGSYGGGSYGGGSTPGNCPDRDGGICCVSQTEYPVPANLNEECVIDVANDNGMFLRVMDFEAGAGDVLIVNGQNYSGYQGPSGIVPQGTIRFIADGNEDGLRGFGLCLVPEAPTPITEVPNAGWRVLTGQCTVDADGSVSSPNFLEGLEYDKHGCTIEVDANNSKYIDVASFKTETDSDFLYINGKYVDGIKDSAELLGPPQGLIKWAPNSNEKYAAGWRLCLTDAVPESPWKGMDFPEQEVRSQHSAVWDNAEQMMLVYGGSGTSSRTTVSNLLVKYDFQANAWTSLHPTMESMFSARVSHTAVWDPAGRVMLVFGGNDFVSSNPRSFISELLIYNLEANSLIDPKPSLRGVTWDPERFKFTRHPVFDAAGALEDCKTLLSESALTSCTDFQESEDAEFLECCMKSRHLGRDAHTAVWDPHFRTMWVFGGRVRNGALADNFVTNDNRDTADLLKYELEGNSWTTVSADEGVWPAGMSNHLAVWAAAERSMYILERFEKPDYFLEYYLWRYDTQANSWIKLPPIEMQPQMDRGARMAAAWDAGTRAILVSNTDIWEVEPQANSTTASSATVFGGATKMGYRRWEHTMVFAPPARQLLAFGGAGYSAQRPGDASSQALSDIVTFTKEACQPDASNDCQCVAGFEVRENRSCEACPAGRFKDTSGSAPCETCPVASVSIGAGNVECTSCPRGLASAEDRTGCVPVLSAALSQWICPRYQVCNVPSLPGLSEYGQHYRIFLTASACNATQHDTVPGILNGGMSSYGEDNFGWGLNKRDFHPAPGTLSVCLCVSLYCLHPWAFPISVGELVVVGPADSQTGVWPCVRGRDCNDIELLGGALTVNHSRVLVQRASCGSSFSIEVQEATLKRAEIVGDQQMSRLTMAFEYVQLELKFASADFYICWCAVYGEGDCQEPIDWLHAGRMRIQGPHYPQTAQCAVGQVCTFPLITGQDIYRGDRLMVLEVCGAGTPLPGFPGDGILETQGNGTDDGQEFLFIGEGSQEVRGRPGVYFLCFCRPVAEVDNCTLARHFTQATGFLVLAGPLEKVTTCELGADCTVDLLGSNLAIGDRVTVVAGNDCAAGPVSMGPVGYENLTSTLLVTKTEAQFQVLLGVPDYDGTPGAYRLCWCAANAECSSPEAFVPAGQVEFTCPPGRYSMGPSSGRKCRLCTRGDYCAGGSDDLALAVACPARRTTKTAGAAVQAACECDRGYRLGDDLQSCVSCAVGFYKDEISNAGSCKACPEGLTTYMLGSVLNTSCISRSELSVESGNVTSGGTEATSSNETTVPAVVARLELVGMLPEAQTNESLSDLQAILLETISHFLGGQEALTLEFVAATERRLASGDMQLAITIKHRTMDEAQLMLQDLDVGAISAGIAESVEGNPLFSSMTTRMSTPSLSEVTIVCPKYFSVPPGVPVLSSSNCQCSVGYGFDASRSTCEPCELGEFKATVGNALCEKCPQWMSTGELAATSQGLCQCQAGRFAQDGACPECLRDHYCPGGGAIIPCPDNSLTTTGDVGGSGLSACICSAGYFAEQVGEGHRCIPCRPGNYKSENGNQDCANTCPTNANSLEGAVDIGDCFCTPGHHAIMGLRNDTEELEICARCNYKGLICEGGLDSTGAHRQPMAEAGFFQTGTVLAAKCQVAFLAGQSVCIGGNECAEGSTGFLCGECPAGYSRNQYPEACSECGTSFSWMGVVVFADIAQNIFVNFVVASLAAMAAVKDSRSVHTSMIRIGTQFVTACSVLSHFDIEQLQVFDWSLEAKIKECAQNEEPCDDLTSLNFEWPSQVNVWLRFVMGVLDIVSKLSAVSYTLACWAEHVSDSKLVKQLVPGLYFVLLPLMAILSSYLLCAFMAYLIVPLLRKVGVEVTEAAKKRKKRKEALDVLGDVLKPHLNLLHLTWKDIKDSTALDVLGLPEIYLGIDDPETLMIDLKPHLLPARVKTGLGRVKEDPKFVSLLKAADLDASACIENADLLALDLDESGLAGLLDPFVELDSDLLDLLVRRALAFSLVKASFAEDPSLALDKLAVAVSQKFSCVADMKRASEAGEFTPAAEEEASSLREKPAEITAKAERGDQELDLDTLDFGLFTKKPSPLRLLHQSVPVIWVTLINMWPGLLSQYLQMIWCQPVQEEDRVVQRLLPHPDVQCWSRDHSQLAIIAIIGLSCWCVCMPLLLILVIWRLKDRNSPENQRRFGYFINGFEPRFWWYDLVVRRLDIAFMMLVTYTSLTDDQRAKLLSYPVISGAQMAICAWLQPFQNSQAQILDFFEIGLAIFRFLLFSMVSVILILAPRREATYILAGSLASLFTLMCLYLGLHILAQFLRDTSHQLDEAEEDEKKILRSNTSGKTSAMKVLTRLVGKVKRFAVKTATPLFQEPSDEQYMLEWCFHSSRIAFQSESSAAARKRKVSIIGNARRWLLRFGRVYQYRSTGKALEDFAQLWLGILRQSALPKDAMEVLCVLTSAHKSVPFKTPKSDIPSLWKSRIEALLSSRGATFRFTPDEMITTIQRLGSLRAADAVELVHATTLQKPSPPADNEASEGNFQLADLPPDVKEDEHALSI